jgi:hypothetical protein
MVRRMMQPSFMPPRQDTMAGQQVTALADRLSRTLGIAYALAENGRQVDLSGIEDGVGLLCAQTLDLPDGLAHDMVPVLREVLSRVDRLTSLLEHG